MDLSCFSAKIANIKMKSLESIRKSPIKWYFVLQMLLLLLLLLLFFNVNEIIVSQCRGKTILSLVIHFSYYIQ